MENAVMEEVVMKIIASSGQARSLAFNALALAREGEYASAKEKLQEAEESSLLAHQEQTNLLVNEASGEKNELSIFLIHAQDHLMTSMLALELITEMVHLYETKQDRKDGEK